MSYKYTKGSQVIGDLKAADDAERNTMIDFGEDQIDLQTSGSVRAQINNNGVDITGNLTTTGDITVGGNDLVVGEFTSQADLYLNAGTLGSRLFLRGTGDAMSAGDNIGAVYFDATENDGGTIGTAGWMIAEPTSTTYVVGSDMPTRIKFGVALNDSSAPTDVLFVDGNSTVGRVGILDSTPSYTLDVNGDIRVTDDLFVDDYAKINALRVGTTFTDPGDGNLFVEGDATIDSNLTVNSNIYDYQNKSFIKHMDHGRFVNGDANTNEAFVPDDSITDYGGSNYITTFIPAYSGSIDKIVIRGVNNTDLSDLGNLTATVKIGNQGTNSYTIDDYPDSFESVTIISSSLGAETNAVFQFSSSNFTPQDVYCVSFTPTNNWNTNGTKYINFTIVSSYLLD